MDIVVLDLDGSLLRSDRTVSEASRQVLAQVKALGHVLVFATARPPRAAMAVLPPEFQEDHLVCYNGAQVLRRGGVLMERTIPAADVARVFSQLETHAPAVACGFEHADQLYVTGSFERHFAAEFCTPVSRRRLRFSDSPKILVDLLDGLEFAALARQLPASCHAICTDRGGLCQIMPAGVTKESGVAWVLARLGVGFERVVCFGDDHNDLPLFRRAGHAVAMGNAIPELKAIAHAVTGTNDEDGVAAFLAGRYPCSCPAAVAKA